MQTWMPMQNWQPQVSGAGCQVLAADLLRSSHGDRKQGVGGWRGHIGRFKSHF